MTINDNGTITYDSLKEILSLRYLPDISKKIYKELLNKEIYYEDNDSCKVGTLVGLLEEFFIYYYLILDKDNKLKRVDLYKSLTELK